MSDAFSTSPETRRSAYNVTSQSQPASTPATSRHSMSFYDNYAPSSSEEPSSCGQIAADRAAAGAERLHNDLAGGEYEDAATSPAPWDDAKLGANLKRNKGRGSHRSHRGRTSGGFLLGDPTFYVSPLPYHDRVAQGTPSRHSSSREGEKDRKGKGVAHSRTSKSLHSQRSPVLVGNGTIGGSPLRHKIGGTTSPRSGSGAMGGDGAADVPSVQKVLDVDSAKIVNLALNLSESRRQAGMGRRVGSSAMPPAAAGIGMGWEDGYPAGGVSGGVGGSLRQHLQAQRRMSRNMSPKPEQGARTFASPRLGGLGMQEAPERTSSPLMEAFDPDGAYHYEFSRATLDRAEKARNAIELMAQYRRLLLYLPPLKPSVVSRTTTISPPSTSHGSPIGAAFSKSPPGTADGRPLGRQYNPLQYIRNRKVRARERQPIDGHTEGFGDVEAVTAWVNRIASAAEAGEYDMTDVLELPPLIPEGPDLELVPSASHASPELTILKAGLVALKPKRPKNDWVINGPDMLADVVWLEHGDNKRLIEDNRERKIFPTRQPLVRMHTGNSSDFEKRKRESEKELEKEEQGEGKKPRFAPLKLDTKLPVFNPIRKERSKERKPWGRNKLKLSTSRDFSRPPDGYYAKNKGQMSDEGTSGSERPTFSSLRRRRPRAGTQDSYDLGRDVLEKQMTELLRKETAASGKDGTPERPEVRRILSAMEMHSPMPLDLDSASGSGPFKGGSRAASGGRPMRSGSLNLDNRGSTRQSPEVWGPGNGHRPRLSLGMATYYDTTTPNSPEPKAKRMAGFIPNLSMDLSSPPSRRHSPSRKPALQRVRSKISRLRDRSAEPQWKNDSRADGSVEQGERSPEAKGAPRSPSPTKNVLRHQKRLTTDNIDSPTVAALIAPKAVESGWKISKSRNPLARVGELFRNRKDDSCSDTEDEAGFDSSKEQLDSLRGSGQVDKNGLPIPTHSKPPSRSFLDEMPKFKSPFDRGRTLPSKESGPGFNPLSPIISGDRSPGSRGPSKPGNLDDELEKQDHLKPPRIEIDRASNDFSTDADGNATEDATHHTPLSHRGSQASNLSARSASSGYSNLTRVLSADSHLRHVLGVPPGYSAPEQHFLLPVTGLARLDHGKRKGSKGSYVEENLRPGERHMVNRREIARVRALLLSAGIKAKEITRRAAEVPQAPDPTDWRKLRPHDSMVRKHDSEILSTVPSAQRFVVAGRLLEQDIVTSFQVLGQSVQTYTTSVIPSIYHRIEDLQWRGDTSTISLPSPTMPTNPDPYTTTTTSRLELGHANPSEGLMQRAEVLSNEADELSREVLSRQIMKVKALAEAMDGMARKRRRRFRWVRRGGWVVVEWALVGVMWWVWLVVVVLRMMRGLGRGVSRGLGWLLWL